MEYYVNDFINQHKKFVVKYSNYLVDYDIIDECDQYEDYYSNETMLMQINKLAQEKWIKLISNELETQISVVKQVIRKHWCFNISENNNDYKDEYDSDTETVYAFREEKLPLIILLFFHTLYIYI